MDREIRRIRQAVEDAGARLDRAREIDVGIETAKRKLVSLYAERDSICREYDAMGERMGEPRSQGPVQSSGFSENLRARWARIAAFAALVADLPLSIYLWRAALNVPDGVAWLIGTIVTVCTGLIAHASLVVFVADRERPLRSRRLCLRFALWTTISCAVFGVALLFVRYAPSEAGPWLEFIVPGALLGLGLGLPVAAGALFAWSHFASWRERWDSELFRVTKKIEEWEVLQAWLVRRGQESGFGGGITAVVVAAVTVFSMVLSAHSIGATEVSNGTLCEIFVDWSRSSAPNRAEAIDRLIQHLDQTTAAFGCEVLRIGMVSEQHRLLGEFSLPEKELAECPTPSPGRYDVFKALRDRRVEKNEQNCTRQREAVRARFETQQADALRKAADLLRHRPENLRGRCTALADLIEERIRLAQKPTTLILATDGIETCRTNRLKLRRSAAVRVVAILLPADERFEASHANVRWIDWEREVGAAVLPFSDWGPSRIDEIAQLSLPPSDEFLCGRDPATHVKKKEVKRNDQRD